MNLKATLFSIFSVSIFSLGIWVIILFNIDPTKSDTLTYLAFLASLYLWVSGFYSLIEYNSKYFSNREIKYTYLPHAIRHGLLISTVLCILLALQLFRVFNIFDTILIIILAIACELYFRARSVHA